MSLPFVSTADLPQGFGTVTIEGTTYVVNDISNLRYSDNKVISRASGVGKRSDFLITHGEDQIVIEFELQKPDTDTPNPPNGAEFTYDVDNAVQITCVTLDSDTQIGKSKFDTFGLRAVLKFTDNHIEVFGAVATITNGVFQKVGLGDPFPSKYNGRDYWQNLDGTYIRWDSANNRYEIIEGAITYYISSTGATDPVTTDWTSFVGIYDPPPSSVEYLV
jgi:hypothetical protein